MKKAVSVILALALILTMAACGSKSEEKNKDGHVADKYHAMLDGDDARYYYEADVEDEFLDEGVRDEDAEGPTKSVMAEGRDGKDRFALMEGEEKLETRQVDIDKVSYMISDADKEYTKEKLEAEDETKLAYVKTDRMELDGKTYKYDEYQDSYEMPAEPEEGEEADEEAMDTYLYIKRFLVDDQGELVALVYRQEMKGEEGQENMPIYQRIERITQLKDSAPEDIFEIPKDYKEVEDLDQGEDDEELSEEE